MNVLRRLLLWLQRVWAVVREPLMFLKPIRFVVIPLVLLLLGLILAAEGQDAIRALVDFDKKCTHWGRIAWFVVCTTLLALQSWYWSRQLLRIDFPGHHDGEWPKLEKFTPRALGVLAFVIAAVALIRAAFRYGPGWDYTSFVIAVTCGLLAVMLILFLWFVVWRRAKIGPSPRVTSPDELSRLTRAVLRVTLVAAFLFVVWTALSPLTAGIIFPSPVLLMFSATLWVGAGSWIAYTSDHYRVPLELTFLLLALLFSLFNDNHTIRTLDTPVPERPNIARHFHDWYAMLKTKSGNPAPPVYIVATEGGGIRAAYWTAAVLTAIQQQSPEFSKHVFAISSVSGGSVGSAVFTSLVADGKGAGRDNCGTEQTSIRFAAQQTLSYDALAPTLASLLQADFAQRFLPVGFIPDRQRALEHGWERGWNTGVEPRDQFLGSGMLAMYGQHANELFPSMFLNATNVEHGRRSIASNCVIDPKEVADTDDLFLQLKRDMPISAAAGNSARFTYVSPAGSIRPDGQWFTGLTGHVVDGGYFENSGAATATDVARVILDAAKPEVINLHLILIKFVEVPEPSVPPTRFATEILSPVTALLNTRGGRGVLAYQQAHDLFPNYQFLLGQTKNGIVLPLGWLLAQRTRNAIDIQVGTNDNPAGLDPHLLPIVQQNVANLKEIVKAVDPAAVLKPDVVQDEAGRSERSLEAGAQ
jgi:hypothetical protein